MAEAILVNRTRFTSSLKNELMDGFNKLAQETRIPKSRLIDEAIEDLLKKYEKRMAEYRPSVFFAGEGGGGKPPLYMASPSKGEAVSRQAD